MKTDIQQQELKDIKVPIKQPIVTLNDVSKTFRDPKHIEILKEINLDILKGDSLAVIGRSGEGKTTLLNMVGLLDKPDSGTVTFHSPINSKSSPEQIRNESLGFVFQSFHLLDHLTALDNILMPAKIGRKNTKPGSPAHHRGLELLKAVGLEGREEFNAKLLSGGEKQRVAIARALCNNPDIILADEPTGNLDSETAAVIEELLFNLCHQFNKTLIIVTHDQQLARKCSRQLVLEGGKLHSIN